MFNYKKMICCALSATTVIGVAPVASNAINSDKVDLQGSNRFETANKIALNYFKSAENVILVNSDAIADALSVAPYAKKLNAPVLLSKSDSLDKKTEDTLKKLNPKNIILVGGDKSLSKTLENNLRKSYKIERISGLDRIDTSIQIANEMGQPIKSAFVVNGYTGLADAAGAGGIAAKLDLPLVFTDKNEDRYKTSLNSLNINNVFLIGGNYNIPESFNKIVKSERIAGPNRRATNAKLIEKFFDKNYENAFIAKNGSDNESELIDSVTIGCVAGLKNMPIFLGSKATGLTSEQLEELKLSTPQHIIGVGGGNSEAGKQIEMQLPHAQIDISGITPKYEDSSSTNSGGGGGGGSHSSNTDKNKQNLLIKNANEHLNQLVTKINNNPVINKILDMNFDQNSNKTTVTIIADQIPENIDEIKNTGFIEGILNTPDLESYSVVDGKNELVKIKTNDTKISAQELKSKILEDIENVLANQLSDFDDSNTQNISEDASETIEEKTNDNQEMNLAYDVIKNSIEKIDGKTITVHANYNDGKTKVSTDYDFIFKLDKDLVNKNTILSNANKHLASLVGSVSKNESVANYADISFNSDSMVTNIVSSELTKLPNDEELKALSGTGFIKGLKDTPNLLSYSIDGKKTVIKGENNENELKNSIINDVLAQFEDIDSLSKLPENKTITVTANFEDGDVKLSQDYKFNFDFSKIKNAIEKEVQINTENEAISKINISTENLSLSSDIEKKKLI